MCDPTDIPMWRRIDARLTTSGQPNEEHLAALGRIGVEHVINLGLHSHEKALADERASVEALRMAYRHIPVEFDAPTEADFAEFCAAMRALEGSVVHVHCIMNLRVSAFLYRYRCEVLGLAKGRAAAEMDSIWRPGGVWAGFVGRDTDQDLPHRYAGRDYDPEPAQGGRGLAFGQPPS